MITSSQVREELVTPCNSIWLVLRNLNNNSGIWKYYGAAREAPRRTVFRYRWMTVGEVFRELARLEELVAVDTIRTREPRKADVCYDASNPGRQRAGCDPGPNNSRQRGRPGRAEPFGYFRTNTRRQVAEVFLGPNSKTFSRWY